MTKNKPKVIKKALVDADMVAYRAAFATNKETDSEQDCLDAIDGLMDWIIDSTVSFKTETNLLGYLTGKGNFRYEIAKSHVYKGNRSDKPKPIHLQAAYGYLVDKWGCVVVEGQEADDSIATEQTNSDVETTVMVSADKDFKTVEGYLWNFTNDKWIYQSKWDALLYFYEQILTGDTADNIKGIYRVGPKKAQIILANAKTEKDLYDACVEAYSKDMSKDTPDLFKSVESLAKDRILENGRLLHLRRYENQMWEPPM